MGLFDRAINAAADVARTNSAHYAREQRRRAIDDQLRTQQQAAQWATITLGRIALDRAGRGVPLPERVRPAADAIMSWRREIAALEQRLAVVDHQLGAPRPG